MSVNPNICRIQAEVGYCLEILAKGWDKDPPWVKRNKDGTFGSGGGSDSSSSSDSDAVGDAKSNVGAADAAARQAKLNKRINEIGSIALGLGVAGVATALLGKYGKDHIAKAVEGLGHLPGIKKDFQTLASHLKKRKAAEKIAVPSAYPDLFQIATSQKFQKLVEKFGDMEIVDGLEKVLKQFRRTPKERLELMSKNYEELGKQLLDDLEKAATSGKYDKSAEAVGAMAIGAGVLFAYSSAMGAAAETIGASVASMVSEKEN